MLPNFSLDFAHQVHSSIIQFNSVEILLERSDEGLSLHFVDPQAEGPLVTGDAGITAADGVTGVNDSRHVLEFRSGQLTSSPTLNDSVKSVDQP